MVKVSSLYDDLVNYCETHGQVPSWATRQQVQEVFDGLEEEDREKVEYILYQYLMGQN